MSVSGAQSRHLLWLTENYPPSRGGMAQSCDRIVENLRDHGVRVDVVHFQGGEHRIRVQQKRNGYYLACALGEDYGHAMNCLWNRLHHDETFAGVTQVVAFGGYYSMKAAPVYAAWLDKPLLTMLRGNDFDAGVFSTKKQGVLFEALHRSRRIACVCREMAEKVNRLIPGEKARATPNGIDLDDWSALPGHRDWARAWRARHVPEGKKVLGVFGQIKLKKGVKFLLDTLQRSGLAQHFHCLLVGDFDEHLHAWLETDNEVAYSLYDFKDRYELIEYYLACDIIAIPSFYDGMPNVLLEAGGLGLPVLASSVCGMRDVLSDARHGFVFAPGDFHQCREALHRLSLSNAQDLARMGRDLRAHLGAHYNERLEVERLLAVLCDEDEPPVFDSLPGRAGGESS